MYAVDFVRDRVAGPLEPVRDACPHGDLPPVGREEGLDPCEGVVLVDPVPVAAVQPGQSPHAVRNLVEGEWAGRVAGIGAAVEEVLHHDQVVEARLVDHHGVHERVVDGEFGTGREQPGLVEEVAVAGVDLAPAGDVGLGLHEDGAGPRPGGVGDVEAGPAVRPVVTEPELDGPDLDAGVPGGEGRGHPRGIDVVPPRRDRQWVAACRGHPLTFRRSDADVRQGVTQVSETRRKRERR